MAQQDAGSAAPAGSLLAICADDPVLFESAMARLHRPPARLVLMSVKPPRGDSALGHLMTTSQALRIPAVPGPKAGEVDLITHSLPGLSSLAPATAALSALFPGLRETGRLRVARLAPADLVQVLADLPEPIALWIDLPGAEAEILAALAAAGILQRVQSLELRCGIEPFFVGAEGRAEIETRLGALDFTLDAVSDADPDWPILRFRADPQARRLRMQEVELAETQALLTARDAALAEAQAAAKRQAQALDRARKTIAARDAELAEIQAALAAREAALAEVQAGAAAVQQQAEARIAELEAELAGQRHDQQALQAEMAAAREQIAALDNAGRERLAALEAEAARARDLTARNAELHHRCQAAREDLRRAEGQMTLLKDLLLREAGL